MAENVQTEEKKLPVSSAKKSVRTDYILTVGRRKGAVAQVRLYPKVKDGLMFGDQVVKKGDIIVNEKHISAYFSGDRAKITYMEPLRVTNTLNSYAITVKVRGGGMAGQMDAFIHGVARALSLADKEKHYPILKKKGFLTRDARVRQRRKVGMGGKSRRKRQSPKR